MNDNDTVALAIQTLLDNKKLPTAMAISDLTGIRTQYIYKSPSFRPFVLPRKKKLQPGPVTTYKAEDFCGADWISKESIEPSEESYRNFITDSYFFHPETLSKVKQDMLTSINSFDSNIFNNAMMPLIRTGALVQAKPRGKDDIARYVWAETHKIEVGAPAAPVALKAPPIVQVPAKLITFKSGYRKDKVKEATADLLVKIAEYVTASGEDDPEILKLEEFARATLKKIQKAELS